MRIRVVRAAARDFRPLGEKDAAAWIKPWEEVASLGTQMEVIRVVRGAETIESLYDAEIAAPFILEEVEKAEGEGVDAVIIHCMADPALEAAREIVSIPVLGEGLACFLTAMALGRRFSIISPGGADSPLYERNMRIYGLADHLGSVRGLDIPIAQLRTDLRALKEAFIVQARRAIEMDGAEVIVPGCGEIHGIAQEATEELGIPVLDPIATVVAFAEMLVNLSLSCSKRAYPNPPPKRREI